MKERKKFQTLLEQRFKSYIKNDILPMSGVWFNHDDTYHHGRVAKRAAQLADDVMRDVDVYLIKVAKEQIIEKEKK